jgi:hypothetical protein
MQQFKIIFKWRVKYAGEKSMRLWQPDYFFERALTQAAAREQFAQAWSGTNDFEIIEIVEVGVN